MFDKSGGYGGEDRMCDLVCDRYAVLQVMSRFGIALGFGDKTIAEVCADNQVDTATFLAVVNLLMNFGNGEGAGRGGLGPFADRLSAQLPRLFPGLPASGHPAETDRGGGLLAERRIVRHHAFFFDEYVAEVQRHMDYEEKRVFPMWSRCSRGEEHDLLDGDLPPAARPGGREALRELKNIIIKYYPSGSTNQLNGVLFDIFTCEQEPGVAQRRGGRDLHSGR